jgi:hypothetical protein
LDDIVGAWTGRPVPALSDPETCGEDLNRNLDIVARLARVHCKECHGHHIRYAVSRLVQDKTPIDFDRAELFAGIRRAAEAVAASRGGPIHIVIGGAADTGILATCAHAVAQSPVLATRVRFTVLDICETPLLLCREFGKWHGLQVDTRTVDLRQPHFALAADVIVLHSILRQIDVAYHRPLLAGMAGWLGPRGSIVFSNRLHAPKGTMSRQGRIEILQQRYERGEIQISMPLQEIIDSLVVRDEWPHDYESVGEIRQLIADSGLAIETESLLESIATIDPGVRRPEDRYLAILRRIEP